MTRALQGIRILDLTRMLPGPYATMILADLGAEVIKIEDTRGGDPTRWSARHNTSRGSTFTLINRGKKSLSIDLKSGQGAEVFRRLAARSDVVIEGFRPGVMERLGFGYEQLRALAPGVVFCSISGYGQDGPYRERAGHDVNYLALAGVLGLQTDRGGTPVLSGIQVADLTGALFAVIAVLAALTARDRTGEGQRIDLSMADASMALLPVPAARLFAGEPVPLAARLPLSGHLACYNVYRTADGRHLSVGALEEKFWETFCRVIDREDFVPRQTDAEAQAGMIEAIGESIAARPLADWVERFRNEDACVEPVLSLQEAFLSAQATHRGMVSGGQLALPFKLSATPVDPPAAAPGLGEHTRAILSETGFSDQEIDALLAGRVVADGSSAR
jgi:crotonobetainyl-CoA:carnitine CoA-transferase CaiB-like acyl-CoA transferase